jgi:magnesium-protoporphyrin IX monomethyl ester (oxidative) cyclase
MKTDPKLTRGHNVWWIKFFLTAVYATMYIRDHQRPAFHQALGVDTDWYAHEVFTKTSELSKQIFPITLDIDSPTWLPTLKKLQAANVDLAKAEKSGAKIAAMSARLRAAKAFVTLFLIPAKRHDVPSVTRLEPCY